MTAITLPPALSVHPARNLTRRPVKETNTMTIHPFAGFTLPSLLVLDAVPAERIAS